mmetsp:Transcript_16874/g.57063  ORF Transcript_16874/g.57063 Transcript_16874/m.57063 type:complete len:262 (-) Transcript_16874:467-1252(-)
MQKKGPTSTTTAARDPSRRTRWRRHGLAGSIISTCAGPLLPTMNWARSMVMRFSKKTCHDGVMAKSWGAIVHPGIECCTLCCSTHAESCSTNSNRISPSIGCCAHVKVTSLFADGSTCGCAVKHLARSNAPSTIPPSIVTPRISPPPSKVPGSLFCGSHSPSVSKVLASSSCGTPASHSARTFLPQATTFVLATFFSLTSPALASQPPPRCVPKVLRKIMASAFSSARNWRVSTNRPWNRPEVGVSKSMDSTKPSPSRTCS